MEIKRHDVDDEVVMEIGKFAILWNFYERFFFNYDCNKKEQCVNAILIVIRNSN